MLWDPATPFHRAMLKEIDAAAPSLRLQPLAIAVKGRDDLGSALSEITRGRADALFVNQGMSPVARRQLLDFAGKNRLPTMFLNRELVSAGGLMWSRRRTREWRRLRPGRSRGHYVAGGLRKWTDKITAVHVHRLVLEAFVGPPTIGGWP